MTKRSDSRHCAGMAEVVTPDGCLHVIACGVYRRRHGGWHANRNVRWRGRYIHAETISETAQHLLREVTP